MEYHLEAGQLLVSLIFHNLKQCVRSLQYTESSSCYHVGSCSQTLVTPAIVEENETLFPDVGAQRLIFASVYTHLHKATHIIIMRECGFVFGGGSVCQRSKEIYYGKYAFYGHYLNAS